MPYGSDPTVPPAGAGGYGKDPTAPTAKPEEGLSRFLPSFMKGPSVWEQLATEGSNMQEEKQRLGRDLTQSEIVHLALQNPIAMGFGTHQVGELPSGISKNIAAAGKNAVDTSASRAIRPSTPEARAAIPPAIDSIITNKPNLQFTDPKTGEQIKGQAPESLEQFKEAIGQTKKATFDKYDNMVKQGQATGIQIPLTNAVQELSNIANDRVTSALHPDVAKYAIKKINGLRKLADLSPSEIQQEIQNLNSSLNAFYRNPKPNKLGRANVDAMLANILRKDLDTTITSTVGPGYQELKNEYGSLSKIEKDVERADRRASQAAGGFVGRIADVTSAAEVIHGLFTMNPTTMAAGLATKLGAAYVKWLRNPHRAVKQAFKEAEAQKNAPTGPTPPVVPSAPISPFTLTQQPTGLDQTLQQSGAP